MTWKEQPWDGPHLARDPGGNPSWDMRKSLNGDEAWRPWQPAAQPSWRPWTESANEASHFGPMPALDTWKHNFHPRLQLPYARHHPSPPIASGNQMPVGRGSGTVRPKLSHPYASRTRGGKYYDFGAPIDPVELSIEVRSSATRVEVSWKTPRLAYNEVVTFDLKISEQAGGEWIEHTGSLTSFAFNSSPGGGYRLELTCTNDRMVVIGKGEKYVRAVFNLEEMNRLYNRAISNTAIAMHQFHLIYRCKPKAYWNDITFRAGGLMEKYLKDNNGQAASPINGAIRGLFFSARLSNDGRCLPTSSPFGDVRMLVPANRLLDPEIVNYYFSDFYCNKLTHYVTIVICRKDSETDVFCQSRLIRVDPMNNQFLQAVPNPLLGRPDFYVNKSVWVEIYYTESVLLSVGKYDRIKAKGAGSSKIGGLPHNKMCEKCNLYPMTYNRVTTLATKSVGPEEKNLSTFEAIRRQPDLQQFREWEDLAETLCNLVDAVSDEHIPGRMARSRRYSTLFSASSPSPRSSVDENTTSGEATGPPHKRRTLLPTPPYSSATPLDLYSSTSPETRLYPLPRAAIPIPLLSIKFGDSQTLM